MEIVERLKRMKTLVLREVARAAKNGNTDSIVKNAEILKRAEQLIKALNHIKTQTTALEEQIQIASSTDLRVVEEAKQERLSSKTIKEDVSIEMEEKPTDDAKANEESDFEGGKVSEDELKEFFSTQLGEGDLLEPAVTKG